MPSRAVHERFVPSTIGIISPSIPLLCLSSLGRRLVGVDLLSVLVVADSRGWRTVSSALSRADTHYLAVDGARDAVLELEVHFWDGIVLEDAGVGDVACGNGRSVFCWVSGIDGKGKRRTNSGALDHIADGESLDRLILGGAAGAVRAANGLDVAAAFLIASADGGVSLWSLLLLELMSGLL